RGLPAGESGRSSKSSDASFTFVQVSEGPLRPINTRKMLYGHPKARASNSVRTPPYTRAFGERGGTRSSGRFSNPTRFPVVPQPPSATVAAVAKTATPARFAMTALLRYSGGTIPRQRGRSTRLPAREDETN